METLDAIKKRRSVREYKPDSLPDDTLRELMHAATTAASASNAQAWGFIVVREPEKLRWLCAASPGIIGTPPAVIVMCSNIDREYQSYDWMSIGTATQNLLLAATDLGVGVCPIGSFHAESIRVLMNLPKRVKPVLLFALGYPKYIPEPPERRPMSEVCFAEEWGKEF
jgi:nitroreductase